MQNGVHCGDLVKSFPCPFSPHLLNDEDSSNQRVFGCKFGVGVACLLACIDVAENEPCEAPALYLYRSTSSDQGILLESVHLISISQLAHDMCLLRH